MMNFPQKEKVDKEQQTYFSESEIVVIGWPANSFSKSKEGAQKHKSSGNIFVSEHLNFNPQQVAMKKLGSKVLAEHYLFHQPKKSLLYL